MMMPQWLSLVTLLPILERVKLMPSYTNLSLQRQRSLLVWDPKRRLWLLRNSKRKDLWSACAVMVLMIALHWRLRMLVCLWVRLKPLLLPLLCPRSLIFLVLTSCLEKEEQPSWPVFSASNIWPCTQSSKLCPSQSCITVEQISLTQPSCLLICLSLFHWLWLWVILDLIRFSHINSPFLRWLVYPYCLHC